MDLFFFTEILSALLILTFLEVVLWIDKILFVSIIVENSDWDWTGDGYDTHTNFVNGSFHLNEYASQMD